MQNKWLIVVLFCSLFIAVSGVRLDMICNENDDCCYQKGVDCHGADISSTPDVDSFSDCQTLCSLTSQCVFWMYNTDSKRCYLKGDGCKFSAVSWSVWGNSC